MTSSNETVPNDNPCCEIDMSGFGVGPVAVSIKEHVELAMMAGQRMLIVAPTGRGATTMRERLAAAGIDVKSIEDLHKSDRGVAVVTVDDLPPVNTLHETITFPRHIVAAAQGPSASMEDHAAAMVVFDDVGTIRQADFDAVNDWPGRPAGIAASHPASSEMFADRLDSLFGDDVMAREARARHTYVLTDERALMREIGRTIAKAVAPSSSYDPGRENDAFNRRNGRRGNTGRGRFRR